MRDKYLVLGIAAFLFTMMAIIFNNWYWLIGTVAFLLSLIIIAIKE